MNQSAIIASIIIVIALGTLLYLFVFKKSDEPESEIVIEGPSPDNIEGPSPDTIDDVITGGDDEPIPDEDETSLETAPADGEVEDEEITNEVSPYMIKK